MEVTLWGLCDRGPLKAVVETDAVMFVQRSVPHAFTASARRAPVELRTLQGEPVDALYFSRQRALLDARDRMRQELRTPLESDVKPSDRFAMERFVTGSFEIEGRGVTERSRRGRPVTVVRGGRVRGIERALDASRLSICSLDIETDGVDGPVLSFAIVFRSPERSVERVVVVGDGVPNERALLAELFELVGDLDPDVLIGWNVVDFDLVTLQRRASALGLAFDLGRNGEPARILEGERGQVSIARIPGRVVLDGIATLKNATWSFERYSLEHVSQALLGRGKKIDEHLTKQGKIEQIRRMAVEDPQALAAYNLEDAKLVADIFDAADLVGFATARAELVGLPLDRQGGSVAAFDHLYLPRLHRAGYVAPDVGMDVAVTASPGGEVLASVPGLHRDVLSFDFRSLYPSIIRTFKIDPLGLQVALHGPNEDAVEGFDGARFARSPSILPGMIERLTEARRDAIAEGNDALSRAIKIQMNSFYGVLGTPGCRFFDSRLASSITRRGHQIIRRAKAFFEEKGYAVLYGDTDSLFVHAAGRGELTSLGPLLAKEANEVLRQEIAEQHRLESALELRFESHYEWFLMPTVRGSDVGSKKRYAGAVRKAGALQVVLRGLEAVRTDWTPLARRVQAELLRRIFHEEPWEDWLRELRGELFRGALDAELVYRKRLRRDLDAYGAAPPHVRAARLSQDDASGIGLDAIEYVMTTRGPLPLDRLGEPGSSIDYDHYIEKQLEPACDVVLTVLGTTFARVAGAQLGLF